MRLLLVEDEPSMCKALARLLTRHAFIVDVVPDLSQARAAIQGFVYDAVLLDRTLPDGDGLQLIDFCNRIARPNRFIVLSALNRTQQRIEGLELGAYDYIVKPFEPDELIARIRVALRHPAGIARRRQRIGNVTYDEDTREFFVDDQPLLARRREHFLFELLFTRAGRIVQRHDIEEALYGFDIQIESNSIESHISRLRQKLRQEGATLVVQTVRGLGYRLEAADGAAASERSGGAGAAGG